MIYIITGNLDSFWYHYYMESTSPISSLLKVFKQEISAPKDKTVVEADEAPARVYLIKAGFIINYDFNSDGSRGILYLLGPGDIFPISWATNNVIPESYYGALTEAVLLAAHRDDFRAALARDLAFSEYVRERTFALLDAYTSRIRNLEFPRVRQRLAYRLLFMGKYFGELEEGRIKILVPFSHQDLADSIASTRDTINREMIILRKTGIVAYEGEDIWINDVAKLTKILENIDK